MGGLTSQYETKETPELSNYLGQEQKIRPKKFTIGSKVQGLALTWHHFPSESHQSLLKKVLVPV